MRSLSSELRMYVAAAEFSSWGFNSEMKMMHGKRDKSAILAQIKGNLHYGLINEYLFPDFDKYEKAVADFVRSDCKDVHRHPILKSEECPAGGWLTYVNLQFPKNIFHSIENNFIEKFVFKQTSIFCDELPKYFWHNMDLNYDRNASICSLAGGNYGMVRGNCSIVMSGGLESRKLTQMVRNAMLTVVTAWLDKTLRWSSASIRTRKFADNIDELLMRSDNECMRMIGRLLRLVPEVSALMDKPEEFTRTRQDARYDNLYPKEAVEKYAALLEETPGYKRMAEMEDLLCKIRMRLDECDEKVLCDVWNRCARNKVSSRRDVLDNLESKCQAVYSKGLTLLVQRMTYMQVAPLCLDDFILDVEFL